MYSLRVNLYCVINIINGTCALHVFGLFFSVHRLCKTFNFYFYRSFAAFRTNKFCNERLRIDNEPTEQLKTSPKMVRTKKGDPVAEARIQNELSFTHLKIIKSTDEDLQPDSVSPMTTGETPKKQKSPRVYSQVMKDTIF